MLTAQLQAPCMLKCNNLASMAGNFLIRDHHESLKSSFGVILLTCALFQVAYVLHNSVLGDVARIVIRSGLCCGIVQQDACQGTVLSKNVVITIHANFVSGMEFWLYDIANSSEMCMYLDHASNYL